MVLNLKQILFVALVLPGLTACAALDRRFENESSRHYAPAHNPITTKHELEAREELGLPMGGYLSSSDQNRLQERVYLKELESRLNTRAEKAQYYQVKSSMSSDRERIQFLLLGSREQKARWITSRGLNRRDAHPEEIASAIEAKDIALGMTESAVRESWGDPDLIEVAGDSVYGYKRWRYRRIVSGNDGYQRELRLVYFEGGHVVGWETYDL